MIILTPPQRPRREGFLRDHLESLMPVPAPGMMKMELGRKMQSVSHDV